MKQLLFLALITTLLFSLETERIRDVINTKHFNRSVTIFTFVS